MNKRGFEIAFGMIFSIVLIAATLAIAVYAIVFFLDFGKCADTGLLFNDFKDRVSGAWREDFTRDTFTGNVPSEVDYVCFGDISMAVANSNDESIRNEIKRKGGTISKKNMFIYPLGAACQDLFATEVEHMQAEEFFCVKVENREISVKIEKKETDTLVTVSKIK